MRVRLSSTEDARSVLGHLPSLSDGSDKTFAQRAEIHKLHKQMQQNNTANPQQQVTIHYVNNVPTLVDTSEPRSRRAPGGLAVSNSRHPHGRSITSALALRPNGYRG